MLLQITACAPQTRNVLLPNEDCAPKESNRPRPPACISVPVPHKILLVIPQAEVKPLSRTKNTNERQDKVLHFAPKTLFLFGLHSKICGQEARSAPQDCVEPHQASNVPPEQKIVPRKEANGSYPRGVIWNKAFFCVFTPKFEEKFLFTRRA